MKKSGKIFTTVLILAILFSASVLPAKAFDLNAFIHHSHNYKSVITISATCQKKGFSFSFCRTCFLPSFRILGKTDHNWVYSEAEPNCTNDGYEARTCSWCKTSERTDIAATGHQYSDWAADGDREKQVCEKCGHIRYRDESGIITDARGDTENRETITTGISGSDPADIGDYVTPGMYGAYGDDIHDDSAAIQSAVDSGKNVLFEDGRTYYIAPEKYIEITDKTNFVMSGGTIHKGASDSNNKCFVITGCTGCVFQNMFIRSEFTAQNFMTPANHTRPTEYNSNVLAFSGWNNNNIKFINNSFEKMNSDYWFNASPSKGEWSNILIDGWKSTTSIMALYCQYIDGLEIRNASLSISETYSGDGDHILYVCEMSRNVRIHDCYFAGKAGDVKCVLLTFHGGNNSYNTNPRDIVITDCTIYAGSNRPIYSGNGADVKLVSCTLNNSTDAEDLYLVSGDSSNKFYFESCILDSNSSTYCINGVKEITLDNCLVRENGAGVFAGPGKVSVYDSDIEIGKGCLCFSNTSEGFDYTFGNCSITKTSPSVYLTSIRKSGGSLSFTGCSISCPDTTYFMYNAGVDMSAVTFENTDLTVTSLANEDEAKGYKSAGSYINGAAF